MSGLIILGTPIAGAALVLSAAVLAEKSLADQVSVEIIEMADRSPTDIRPPRNKSQVLASSHCTSDEARFLIKLVAVPNPAGSECDPREGW